jgi:hypothetical protein
VGLNAFIYLRTNFTYQSSNCAEGSKVLKALTNVLLNIFTSFNFLKLFSSDNSSNRETARNKKSDKHKNNKLKCLQA